MEDVKTPYDLWVDLKDMVADLEKDAIKATRGMKAGGVRLRSSLQSIREHCQDLRKAVLEFRSAPRSKTETAAPAATPISSAPVTSPSSPVVMPASSMVASSSGSFFGSASNNGSSTNSYESPEAMSGLHAFAGVNRAV